MFNTLFGRVKKHHVKPEIDLLNEDVFWCFDDEDLLAKELIADIIENPVDKILLIGAVLGEEYIIQTIQERLVDKYAIHVNQECSLKWLCKKMAIMRKGIASPMLVISNFPVEFEGTPQVSFYSSLTSSCHTIRVPGGNLSPRIPSDIETPLKVYWFGLEPYSFLRRLWIFFCMPAPERTVFRCLVLSEDDDMLVRSERNRLSKAKDAISKRRLLLNTAKRIDKQGYQPKVGILRDEI